MLKQLISQVTRGGGRRGGTGTPGGAGGGRPAGGGSGSDAAVGRGVKKLFRRLR